MSDIGAQMLDIIYIGRPISILDVLYDIGSSGVIFS